MMSDMLIVLAYTITSTFGAVILPTVSNSTHEIYVANVSYVWVDDTITCGTPYCIVGCLAEYACQNLAIDPSSIESISLTCSNKSCDNLKISQPSQVAADISCIGEGSCTDARFSLVSTPTINLLCGDSAGSDFGSKGSCQNVVLHATNAMNVNIECGGIGKQMCLSAAFHLQEVTNTATITANGYKALTSLVSPGAWPGSFGIMAHNTNKLTINCMSEDSCHRLPIYPPYHSEYAFSLKCADENNACGNPKQSATFTWVILNNSNYVTNFMDLYCTQNVVDTSCNIRIYCPYPQLYEGMEYSSTHYRYQCKDNRCCPWEDYKLISKPPTKGPTNYPSESPFLTTITNNPSQAPITYTSSSISAIENPSETSFVTDAMIVCAVVFLVCIILVIILWLYVKKNKTRVPTSKHEIIINNALVVFVAIGEYEDDPHDPDDQLKTLYLPDLAIDNDITNMSQLFGTDYLNYTIYPKYDETVKVHWTQNEIVTLLKDKAKLLEENINKFDGLFVAISSHGIKDYICTSDYKLIEKLAIHRIFSQNHPMCREIPRIFLFDCCAGTQEQGKNIKKKTAEEEKTFVDNEQGKNFTVEQIEKTDSVIWKRNTKNPDYRLVEINAANPGFQSKLRSDIGSYMLHGFVSKMINDLNNNKNQYIHQIFDELQNELQEQGKQLTKNTYNNNTRYIKLTRNNNNANRTVSQPSAVNEIEIATVNTYDSNNI